jgi:hypothetical protein
LVEASDKRISAGGAVDETGREMAPDDGARNEPTSQLSEHEHGIGVAEPDSAFFLRKAQSKDAHLGQLGPEGPVQVRGLLEFGDAVEGQLAIEEAADAFA